MIRMRGDNSSTSITYVGSDCTQMDPATGLCIGNVFLGDPSNATGSGAGGGLPADPGSQDALSSWATSNTAASNSAALSASQSPASLVLAQSLMSGNIPSPLPGLGLTVPDPLKNYLLYGAIAIAALFIITENQNSASGRRRRS